MAPALCWYHLYISGCDESKGQDEFPFSTHTGQTFRLIMHLDLRNILNTLAGWYLELWLFFLCYFIHLLRCISEENCAHCSPMLMLLTAYLADFYSGYLYITSLHFTLELKIKSGFDHRWHLVLQENTAKWINKLFSSATSNVQIQNNPSMVSFWLVVWIRHVLARKCSESTC